MAENPRKLNLVIDIRPSATITDLDRSVNPRSKVNVSGLKARVDQAGLFVLCGQIDCGARLARIFEVDSGKCIEFPAGWDIEPNGTWRQSNYARRRMKKGDTAKLRRYPKQHRMTPSDVMDSPYDNLPVRAVCPTCSRINVITQEATGAYLINRIPPPPER